MPLAVTIPRLMESSNLKHDHAHKCLELAGKMNRDRAQLATMNDSKREWELYKLRDKLDALMVKVPRKIEKLRVKGHV